MVNIQKLLARVFLPYFRLELPGIERLSSFLGLPMRFDHLWEKESPKVIRGKDHRLLMRLDLRDWCERWTYFLGRYYDRPLQLFLNAAVSDGGSFIDVGGNAGMVTLSGVARVGLRGQVHTFEPNPDMVMRIHEQLRLNEITNVTVYEMGLADVNLEMELTIIAQTNGWSTFGTISEKDPNLTYKTLQVPVRRGDDILPPNLPGPVTIKIDVEGFECKVVKGMARLLDRVKPVVVTEVDSILFKNAGSSLRELFDLMDSYGFQAYSLGTVTKFFRKNLKLERLTKPTEPDSKNVVWIHPEGSMRAALVEAIEAPSCLA
jgi:FkbM family methyltransferase